MSSQVQAITTDNFPILQGIQGQFLAKYTGNTATWSSGYTFSNGITGNTTSAMLGGPLITPTTIGVTTGNTFGFTGNDIQINGVTFGAGNTTSGSIDNIAIGYTTLTRPTSGYQNIAIGNIAMGYSTGGGYNVALGVRALSNNISGQSNVAIGGFTMMNNSSGTNNNAIGESALYNLSTGISNNAFGNQALYQVQNGSYNVAIGDTSGTQIAGASYNTFIGYGADCTHSNGSIQYSTAIGAGSNVTIANALVLGGVVGSPGVVNVGIGNSAPTNPLHITPATGSNPLRLEGLQMSTGTTGSTSYNLLTADSMGVVNNVTINTVRGIAASQDWSGLPFTFAPAITYTVPGYSTGVAIYRCNFFGGYESGTGSVAITLNYTDSLNNSHTVSIGTINSSNTVSTYSPFIIKAKAGTVISASYTLTGSMTYGGSVFIEFLTT